MLNLEHGNFLQILPTFEALTTKPSFFCVHLKPFYLALKYTPNLCFSVPQRSDLLGKSCAQIPPQAQEPTTSPNKTDVLAHFCGDGLCGPFF